MSSQDELKNDLLELQQLLGKSTRSRVQNALNFEIRKIEAELQKLEIVVDSNEENLTRHPSKVAAANKSYEVKLQNYAWDQSDNFVKIFVTIDGVQDLPQESVSTLKDERWMELRVSGLENKIYVLKISNLMYPISECSVKIKKDMVVVNMKKQTPGKKWSHVTETEARAAQSKGPKKTPGDSDAEVKDPSAGLMDMMKQMYEDGDDDMKRMIAKAWTEGKGKEPMMNF